MTSASRRLWIACATVGAIVIALAGSLVARAASEGPAPAPAERFALGAPVAVPIGDGAQSVVPTPDGRRVLVLGQADLTVLDAGTGTVVGRIAVRGYYGGLLVAPDGGRAYLRSAEGIEPIDLTTGLIQDPVVGAVDGVPTSLEAVSPDGRRLTGVVQDRQPGIGLVDLATGTARRVPLPSVPIPGGVAASPDGDRVYVARPSTVGRIDEPLQVIDVATGAAGPVPGTAGTLSIALSADGRSIHAIGYTHALVLDAATGAVTRSVPTSLLSGQFVASPGGRYLYVIDVLDDGIEVFDMDSAQVVATVPLGSQPRDLAIAPDGSKLYALTESGLSVVPVTAGR